jgi:biotin carboxyl carrier protein
VDFHIFIDGVEKEIDVDKKGDDYLFTIEGKKYRVNAQPLANGSFAFFVGDRSYVAHVSNGEGGKHLAIGGRNFFIEGDQEDGDRQAGAGASTQTDGKVESPMPGNIVAVNVKEGDTVAADQAVVVIESMKMQNEITSPIAGEVGKVNCSVGDQVNFGDVLVEIMPKE